MLFSKIIVVNGINKFQFFTRYRYSHRASATCMSLAGTHRVFYSNHDLVKPLVNIYIRGMNPLRHWSSGVCDNYLRVYNRVFEIARNSPTTTFSPTTSVCVLRAAHSAQSRHKFVGSPIRRTFEHFFLFWFLISKPHTKSSSTVDCMNIV